MKDFTKTVDTGRVYDTIGEATAQEAPQTQEKRKARKPRKTYTAQEAQAALESNSTAGKKGVKLPRINMAFSPACYEYIQTMARVRGETLTDFVNKIIAAHMQDNEAVYKKAIEFKNSL